MDTGSSHVWLVISWIVLAYNVYLLQLRLRLNAEFEGDLARYKVNPTHTQALKTR